MIGLIGGMSWESTVPYYQTINRVVGERLGGLHSARIVLYSVDFHDIEQLQHAERWSEAGEILVGAAGGGPRDRAPRHLRRALPREDAGGLARRVPEDHGRPRRPRRARLDPRLHGDRPPRPSPGRRRPALRHHAYPRGNGRPLRAVDLSPRRHARACARTRRSCRSATTRGWRRSPPPARDTRTP